MIRSLYWEQRPPSSAAVGAAGLQVPVFVRRTFCERKRGCVGFRNVLRGAFGPLRVGARRGVWHGATLAGGISPEGPPPPPKRLRHPLSSYCIDKCVCVPRRLGAAPSFFPCPRHPQHRCHCTVAGDRCPGAPCRLCPSKQMGISIKSSETGLTAVDHDSSQTASLIAPVPPPPPLRAGTAPVGWPGGRNKQSTSGHRRGSSTVPFRSRQTCDLQFRVSEFPPRHASPLPIADRHPSHPPPAWHLFRLRICLSYFCHPRARPFVGFCSSSP